MCGRIGISSPRWRSSPERRSLRGSMESRWRALRGRSQPTHEYLYWEFHERGFQQAVRTGPWKAVRLQKDGPLELYNLDRDSAERENVAAANPAVVKKIDTYLAT